ncbi:hypothetical protein GJ496_000679 [Pomphorhynchus laevis]|nr:hypothetical protein GJ496_000679 [Pomphorhynchus laevis]
MPKDKPSTEACTLQQFRTLDVRRNRKIDWKKKLITDGKITAAAAVLDDGVNNSFISPKTIVQGKSVGELLQKPNPSPGALSEDAYGSQILGAPISNEEYMDLITSDKVSKWITLIDRLTDVASIDPHVAFCCLTKSTQWKWFHFSRTTPCRCSSLESLRGSIGDRFVPTLLRRDVPSCMLDLLSLPIRYGGLGIERLEHTEHQFEWSSILRECYLTDVTGDILRTTQKELLRRIRSYQDRLNKERMEYIPEKVLSGTVNAIKFASEHRPPVWLSSIPLSVDKFHLTGDEFRDDVSLRYN